MPSRNDLTGDPWNKLPNLSGVTSAQQEDSRSGDPGRFFSSAAVGQLDSVANRITNMPRAKVYNGSNVTGHGPGAGPMAVSAYEYDTDGMAVIGTGAAGAGLKIKTEGIYICESSIVYSAGGMQQSYIQRTGPSGTKIFGVSTTGAAPVQGWIGFPFDPGYSDYGGGYQPCQYMIDPSGFVHLRGLFKFTPPGVYHGPGSAGTLPAAYSPGANEIFHQEGSSTTDFHFRFDVQSNGQCIWREISGGAWDGAFMSMSGITFWAVGGAPPARENCFAIVPCRAGDLIQWFAQTAYATNLTGGIDNNYLTACMISTLGSDQQ